MPPEGLQGRGEAGWAHGPRGSRGITALAVQTQVDGHTPCGWGARSSRCPVPAGGHPTTRGTPTCAQSAAGPGCRGDQRGLGQGLGLLATLGVPGHRRAHQPRPAGGRGVLAAGAVAHVPVSEAPPRPEEAFPRPLALEGKEATLVSGGGGAAVTTLCCCHAGSTGLGGASMTHVATQGPSRPPGHSLMLERLPSQDSPGLVPRRGVGRARGDRQGAGVGPYGPNASPIQGDGLQPGH